MMPNGRTTTKYLICWIINKMTDSKKSLLTGIIFCGLAVILGAFGAHALKTTLSSESLAIWHTAEKYQTIHGLALILLGLWGYQSKKRSRLTYTLFLAGICLFSGSLYALALSDIKILGAITPLGGLSFIAGWISWGVQICKD